ncbi:MAG: DNA polymerase III subunit delta, partial [Brevundimonas sp.]
LALYIGPGSGRTLDLEGLEAHLGVEPDASLQDAALDAFGGRAEKAQGALRRAFAEGESAVSALRQLSLQLQKLRRIAVLTANGAGAKEAAKAAGVFWKQEAEMLRQARSWRLELLEEVHEALYAADAAVRATGSPDQLLAERAVLEIAAKARRAGL